ncbi:MAG: TIGR02996 domain-containing protein [Labilithrix sp.]|nr:TIGR02996 domain-containing protein [Labilithrix sp.]MCW5813146.1 TIGR02996 domain-containing protein [Labilithrix sp.]
MFRITVEDRRGPRTFTFVKDAVTIGRAPERDLVLEIDRVSRLHAEVRFDRARGAVLLEDRSANGVWRGDERVEGPYVVRPDDWLTIGSVRIRVQHDDYELGGVAAPEEQAFLAALLADPRDDETRLVYADWLEEHGKTAHAEFLRTQVAARGKRKDGPSAAEGFAEASARLAELAPLVEVAWRARVAMAAVQACGEQATGRPGRVAFELECTQRWDDMVPTEIEGIRRCTACRKDVAYVTTLEQAYGWAEEGGCVAVDAGISRTAAGVDVPLASLRGRLAPNVASRGTKRLSF